MSFLLNSNVNDGKPYISEQHLQWIADPRKYSDPVPYNSFFRLTTSYNNDKQS